MIPDKSFFTKLQIVLVSPEYPGNVGSVARALKTMGCSRLSIVAPKRYLFLEPEAVWMASSASDLLYAVKVFNTLEDALASSQWVIGTSVRPRSIGEALVPVREGAKQMVSRVAAGEAQEVSLVFGSEPTGLLNQHLLLCQEVWTIPTSTEYTSLNLAQAVQVVLYEVRQSLSEQQGGAPSIEKAPRAPLAPQKAVEGFFKHLEEALTHSGYLNPKEPRYLMEHLRALFNRTSLTISEIDMLRGMLAAWQKQK